MAKVKDSILQRKKEGRGKRLVASLVLMGIDALLDIMKLIFPHAANFHETLNNLYDRFDYNFV
jgi:hypothetical protein